MRAEYSVWRLEDGWLNAGNALNDAHLAICFGTRSVIGSADWFPAMRARYPSAKVVGCSTGGQIMDGDVADDVCTILALRFERTKVRLATAVIEPGADSQEIGLRLGAAVADPDLTGVIVLSDGLYINGSRLVSGLSAALGSRAVIVGGLAGDDAAFGETLVAADGAARVRQVVAVGLIGSHLRIGVGCSGGWSEFGPRRVITRADFNVLYELDGKPALELYKRYLGEEADGLPSTGLLFPLLIRDPKNPTCTLVRTVLAVNGDLGSMTFAGDMPEGWSAQLMRGHLDRLVEAAGAAARQAKMRMADVSGDCATLLVSCIGRRLLMGQNIIDEIAEVQRHTELASKMVGFYSYGEISPGLTGSCELHNQTMTITQFGEVA